MQDTNGHDSKMEKDADSEIIQEEAELADIEGRLEDKVTLVRSKLKECESAKSELFEQLQRARADFLNSKRRIEEQSERNIERATEKIILDLLPLIDSLENALGDTEALTKLDAQWQKGIEGLHALLKNFLSQQHVVEIPADGAHFNPYEHEAIAEKPGGKQEPNGIILEVLQKGYARNDKVIRPAKVIISE